MESAASELFALLVIVYVIECFRWVARGAVLFRDVPPAGAWAAEALQIGSQYRRALAFGWPLPPFGSMYVADGLLVNAGPAGVRLRALELLPGTTPLASERWLPWADIAQLSVDGFELKRGAEVLRVFSSRRAARACLAALQEWAKASDAKRPAALEKALAARFDAKAAGERLRPWRRWRWVVFLANLGLFTALFGGWGLLSFSARPPPFALLLLFMLLAWWVAIGATVLAIRRVLPRDARPTRFQYFLTLFSPLSLLRSPDVIEAELLADLEPAALAVAALKPQAARDWLDRAARELRYPVTPKDSEPGSAGALADDAWLRERQVSQLERLAKGLGATTPKTGAGLHCPRCFTEYAGEATSCSSCPGVALARA